MKFSVAWQPDAETQLARFWGQSSDRAAFASAATHIERMLRFYSVRIGEDRFSGDRVLIESPLGVVFRLIVDDHRMVQVLKV
jgi:hypothetical protein